MELRREIYEVHLAYVNADGFHIADPAVGGQTYPRIVDSRNNDNDLEKTLKKALGFLGAAESFLSTRDDQVSYCYIIRVSDGYQIEKRVFGKIAPVIVPAPEPEPEPEPTPEPTPDPEQEPDPEPEDEPEEEPEGGEQDG